MSEASHRNTVSGQIMTVVRLSYAPSIPLRRVIYALISSPLLPLLSPIQTRFPDRLTIIFSLLARVDVSCGESRLDSAKSYMNTSHTFLKNRLTPPKRVGDCEKVC